MNALRNLIYESATAASGGGGDVTVQLGIVPTGWYRVYHTVECYTDDVTATRLATLHTEPSSGNTRVRVPFQKHEDSVYPTILALQHIAVPEGYRLGGVWRGLAAAKNVVMRAYFWEIPLGDYHPAAFWG